jgi:hypothetical protein
MLKPKKGFENTVIEYRVGTATLKIKVSDITADHIERAKHYCDLSMYVEDVTIVSTPKEYTPSVHNAETVMQDIIDDFRIEQLIDLQTKPKPKRTRKKK